MHSLILKIALKMLFFIFHRKYFNFVVNSKYFVYLGDLNLCTKICVWQWRTQENLSGGEVEKNYYY